jgi:hypothetical protein
VASRLGNILYWFGFSLAVLFIILGFLAYLGGGEYAWEYAGFFGLIGSASWIAGRLLRFILVQT